MGRYYTGDISGKFWFSIQNSDDADHFGCKGIINNYKFLICECLIPDSVIENCETDDKDKSLFCDSCYPSYESHRNNVIEILDTIEDDRLYYLCGEELLYYFDPSHLEIVKEEVDKLEKEYAKYIKHFEIVDDPELEASIEYEVELIDKLESSIEDEVEASAEDDFKLVHIARLCLGRQILYCLEKYDECEFRAEI
jgi:hypothetical protein